MRALVVLAAALPGCVWWQLATAPEPCDEIRGAHACSMVPRRLTCDCDGEVVPADPEDPRSGYCGRILTYCDGTVRGRSEVDGVLNVVGR